MAEQLPPRGDEPTQPVAVPAPQPIAPLTHDQRVKLFGNFTFTADPLVGNKEHIHVNGSWQLDNLITVTIPELANRRATVHKLIAKQFLRLFAAWKTADLMDRVITFDGAYAPRYKRGMSGPAQNLSNHAWASAFDINARWNPLGHQGAALGQPGCILELVPLAHEYGFFCGKDFHSRPDFQHFECYRVIA